VGYYQYNDAIEMRLAEHNWSIGGLDDLMNYMTTIVKDMAHILKTKNKQPIAWRDLEFFLDKFDYNSRKADAWRRA